DVHCSFFYEYGATLGASAYPRYIQSDVLLPFPYPAGERTELQVLGREFIELRERLCRELRVGLTGIMNEFHSRKPKVDVERLRELQIAINEAVLRSYGWNDIALSHDFNLVPYLPKADNMRFTIEDSMREEILHRLAELNRDRYEGEVRAGLHVRKA